MENRSLNQARPVRRSGIAHKNSPAPHSRVGPLLFSSDSWEEECFFIHLATWIFLSFLLEPRSLSPYQCGSVR